MLGHPVANPYRPIRRLPFQWRGGVMIGLLHQVHAHIFHWKVEDGQPSKLMQQHDTLAVGNGHISEDHTHAPATVFPAKSLAERRRSQLAHIYIFKGWSHPVSPL